MTRDELINAIDSPTVAALENVFNGPFKGESYSKQIADVLAPRLVSSAQDANACPSEFVVVPRAALKEIVDNFVNPYDEGPYEVGEVPSLDVLRECLK
ncbi:MULTISPECIES: hypothetical protein [unclassified Bradyrhizobium]|uniref:hypothetical protein n=1 Tax=unclassified Bradyrhizobium TaxID=2631580 RepID=UPI002479E3FC|nr:MULTISPECIES: hypothetical protein [unclassified Bradyrhizobium]WGR74303.1 hypothetical protein MTX24_16395 [Bradyrhizobium sp. ISRA426]WGR79138.1 hypothetical protein MTX21_01510 [Bradyrhizobium sp. ISRA430]WGR90626.1 hypothetical protein MTX25_39655 [Bradyrhizobium sp. ISRA432]